MDPLPAGVGAATEVAEVVGGIVLVGVGLLGVLGLAVLTTTWVVVRRLRRSRRLRRGLTHGRLAVRAVAADEAGRRLARMRLELHRSLEATERCLGTARDCGRPVGDLPSIAAHLLRAGQQLDDELTLADREPDAALRQAWAAWLGDQVHDHARLSADLRRTVLSAGVASAPNHLARATDQLALEAEALRAWNPAYRRGHAA